MTKSIKIYIKQHVSEITFLFYSLRFKTAEGAEIISALNGNESFPKKVSVIPVHYFDFLLTYPNT